MRLTLTALALIVVLASGAGAGVILKDSIGVADTVVTSVRFDTAYTETKTLRGLEAGSVLQFHAEARPLIGGTSYGAGSGDLTADRLYFWVQHSFNGVDWTSVVVDTLFPSTNDTTSNSTIIPDLSAVIYGPYVRGMVIHWDSVGTETADVTDSLANVYYWDCELYIQARH